MQGSLGDRLGHLADIVGRLGEMLGRFGDMSAEWGNRGSWDGKQQRHPVWQWYRITWGIAEA